MRIPALAPAIWFGVKSLTNSITTEPLTADHTDDTDKINPRHPRNLWSIRLLSASSF
jgi:hypothetical protein